MLISSVMEYEQAQAELRILQERLTELQRESPPWRKGVHEIRHSKTDCRT